MRSQLGQSFEHAEHGGRAGHIAFHFGHARRGLDADASAVEGDAFAHQHHGLFALRTLGDIFQHHQPGLLPRAAGHGQKSAHTLGLQLSRTQGPKLHTAPLGHRARRLGKGRGSDHIGRSVGQIAGQAQACRLGFSQAYGVAHGVRREFVVHQQKQPCRIGGQFGPVGQPAIITV